MDKLEEFIRKNRDDLDRYTPSSGNWKGIKNQINKGKISFYKWISIAAMIIIIMISAAILYRTGSRWSDNRDLITSDSGSSLPNPQLNEIEIYYRNLVNNLYREAMPLLTANPEIGKELNTDISQLDSIGSEIKKDLKDNVANKEVIEALIQNYRVKIQLLEDMLAILKENEKTPEKNKNYEL